jgi:hypothetical protein
MKPYLVAAAQPTVARCALLDDGRRSKSSNSSPPTPPRGRLWVWLHAQPLLRSPRASSDGWAEAEDDRRRFTAR